MVWREIGVGGRDVSRNAMSDLIVLSLRLRTWEWRSVLYTHLSWKLRLGSVLPVSKNTLRNPNSTGLAKMYIKNPTRHLLSSQDRTIHRRNLIGAVPSVKLLCWLTCQKRD